jgi:predicted nucleic acid-binding protein
VQQGQLTFPETSTNISMKKTNASALVVADASGLMSLLVDTDANYHKALALSRSLEESQGAVILSSHVFTELMNVLGKKLGHSIAVAAGKRIISNPDYLIVESEEELEEALDRLAHQPSSVSFTDCLVMALADRYGTKLIFGFDEVFRKNGYRLPEATENQQAA